MMDVSRTMPDMLQAHDEAEVAEIIAATSCPLEPVAGGTKRGVGRPPAAEVLDLRALRGIVDYEPHELVLTARPSTPLAEIEAILRANAQRLAFEPPDWTELLAGTGAPDGPTIGGTLAANASGSRRISAGAARDHFLGFRAVSGRGERFKGGGRVVKNVTGYDLPKLLAGSWGTLAVLTEVTVRVHPLPERERTLLLETDRADAAVRMMSTALGSACEVSAAAFVPARGVALRLEGFAPSVRARSAALVDALAGTLAALRAPEHGWLEDDASAQFWRDAGAARRLAGYPIVWRLSVPAADAPRIIDRLAPRDYLLDWGGGLVWIGAQEADAARVRGSLDDGHATLLKAPHEVRLATPVFQPQPAGLATLATRLKAAFDPAGRLNPGRMS